MGGGEGNKRNGIMYVEFFQKCPVVIVVLQKLISLNLKNHMLPYEQ